MYYFYHSESLTNIATTVFLGAMEIMNIFSTSNMMKFLMNSKSNGWQVVIGILCVVVLYYITLLPFCLRTLILSSSRSHVIHL